MHYIPIKFENEYLLDPSCVAVQDHGTILQGGCSVQGIITLRLALLHGALGRPHSMTYHSALLVLVRYSATSRGCNCRQNTNIFSCTIYLAVHTILCFLMFQWIGPMNGLKPFGY